MVLQANKEHAKEIANIYNHYIEHSTHTFELKSIDEKEIWDRISSSKTINWLVYLHSNQVIGYAYAAKWKERAAYAQTAEVSIYLHNEFRRLQLGNELYRELIDQLKKMKFKVLIAGIALPNADSIKFHERLGFYKVAHFEKLGFKFNKWIDVAYWQLML